MVPLYVAVMLIAFAIATFVLLATRINKELDDPFWSTIVSLFATAALGGLSMIAAMIIRGLAIAGA